MMRLLPSMYFIVRSAAELVTLLALAFFKGLSALACYLTDLLPVWKISDTFRRSLEVCTAREGRIVNIVQSEW
jgi:hypothetical protein